MRPSKPFARWAACAALLGAAASAALAADPVNVIVPFGPGSGTDNMARPLFEEMSRDLKQPFVVDNKPGASGTIAAQAAARAAPNGQNLFFTTNTTQAINPVLFKKLPYDPVKDFKPVVSIGTSPYLLLVRKDFPANTLAELLAWVRANPGKASYGWGAAVSQMAGANFVKRENLNAIGVPYKSSPQAVTDLIGGQLTFTFLDLAAAVPVVKGDRVKAILITSASRLPTLPHVPTASEAGLKDFDVAAWFGIFAPAGTPDEVVKRIADSAVKTANSPDMLKRLEGCCFPMVLHGQAFADYVAKDRVKWKEWAQIADIKAE